MQSLRSRREPTAGDALLSLTAWWLLYAGLPILTHAGFDDAGRVICEGASAALMLVLFLRDRRADDIPWPADRAAWPILLLVPVFFAMYAAIEMFCLSDAVRREGPVGISIWYVLRTCVTAPLMEELGCRWIAFYKLRRGFGFWPSVLASVILFSLIHIDVNLKLAVAVIPSSLLYCLVYEFTGKLRYCVAGHVIFNLLALPGTAWSESALERCLWGVPMSIGASLLIAVTAGIVTLCAFRNRIFVRSGALPGRFAES